MGEERQQLHQQQAQTMGSRIPEISSYWNASPWTPPTTMLPGTPTRSPPGFPARPPPRDEDPEVTK